MKSTKIWLDIVYALRREKKACRHCKFFVPRTVVVGSETFIVCSGNICSSKE